jgi:hypothetical protein
LLLLPPQETAAKASRPHAPKRSFMRKIFGPSSTEGNR